MEILLLHAPQPKMKAKSYALCMSPPSSVSYQPESFFRILVLYRKCSKSPDLDTEDM